VCLLINQKAENFKVDKLIEIAGRVDLQVSLNYTKKKILSLSFLHDLIIDINKHLNNLRKIFGKIR
jgi:hypothetical protein